MRIIKRTNAINKSVLYVVQEESGYDKLANSGFGSPLMNKNKYTDIRSFATVEEAQDFLYLYKNNLNPGEELVSK